MSLHEFKKQTDPKYKACTSKRVFKTKNLAKEYAKKGSHYKNIAIYKCPYCDLYHLTNKSKGNKERKYRAMKKKSSDALLWSVLNIHNELTEELITEAHCKAHDCCNLLEYCKASNKCVITDQAKAVVKVMLEKGNGCVYQDGWTEGSPRIYVVKKNDKLVKAGV